MNATNKNKLVCKLLKDAEAMLKDEFSNNEFKQTFATIKTAKARGLLGTHKLFDCCLAESVNIANDILRIRKFDEVKVCAATKQPKALYVYVSLVAVGLIPA